MTDIYTYIVDLPDGIHEIVTPCSGGYTVYLRSTDSYERQREAYRHALQHILDGDFGKEDVQEIEHEAHRGDAV